jgi:SNF2 family DNA or RNA helicase
MLEYNTQALESADFKFVRLDGKMTNKKRAESIKVFQEDDSVMVFLISLKAGGVGLNLTAARHAYIMEYVFLYNCIVAF